MNMKIQNGELPILYGSLPSQPSRSIMWACLLKGLPFELRAPDLGDTDTLGRLNPKLQVPIWVDGDFALYEMAAILIYLCEKHGWKDLLPEDLEARALVHQYLHFHHTSTRLATMKLMGPHVTIAFRERIEAREDAMDVMQIELLTHALRDPDVLENGQATVATICGIIERGYLRDGATHLCGDHPTIADLAAYEDLGQLRRANLFHFEEFPRVRAWLESMDKLPYCDVVHSYNKALGDIRTTPNTLERFIQAATVGMGALGAAGVTIKS
jgi:glutathione S-transferase